MKIFLVILFALSLSAQSLRVSAVLPNPPAGSQDLVQLYLDAASVAILQFSYCGTGRAALKSLDCRPGAAALGAGKTVTCQPSTGAGACTTCVVYGLNSNLIPPTTSANTWSSSVVDCTATVGATLAPSTMTLTGLFAADLTGAPMTVIAQPPYEKVKWFGGDPTVPPPGDTTPPSTPSFLTAKQVLQTVVLSWTVSTDNVGVTGYQVFRNGSNVLTTVVAPPYTDAAVVMGTAYSYSVKACDAASNCSGVSNGASITPVAAISPCDLNQDGLLDIKDVQAAVAADLAGSKDIFYVQKVINAAVPGGTCAIQ